MKILDIHCHHFAMSEANGGFVNPRFAKGIRMRTYAATLKILSWKDSFLAKLPEKEVFDELYRENLITSLNASNIDHAAILAFDGVYDHNGYLDKSRTPKMVTNDAVIELCRRSEKMLFCASINPDRRDWQDELVKCLENGAVMMKWLPNVMGFDPASKASRYYYFYDSLRQNRIPILMHVGFEFAAPNVNVAFAGLDRLEAVLKTGVTVIAAHCCGGRPVFDSRKNFRQVRALVEQYPNLYLDVSALASFHRKSRLMNSLADPLVRERLIYGTDFPIPVHAWAFRKELHRYENTPAELPANHFDLDVLIKRAAGLDEQALSRGYEILKPRLIRLNKTVN